MRGKRNENKAKQASLQSDSDYDNGLCGKTKTVGNVDDIEMIKITIPGTPIPQGRPRFSGGHAYEPRDSKSREYKKVVAMAAETAMMGREPLKGALWCNVTFYMPIPKSLSQKKRMELTGAFVSKKPDTDNLVKAVTDGMNGIVYVDDSQIVRIIAEKKYDENPGAEILIDEVWL